MNNLFFLSEFLGTAILILLGNGVNYSVNATKMFANQSGKWIVIALGWALGVLLGIIISNGIIENAPAHLNPAVSIFFGIIFQNSELLALIPFQFLGAIFAQVILNFINWSHIKETKAEIIAACHHTSPAFKKSYISNFFYEFIGTTVLLAAIFLLNKTFSTMKPVIIALIVLSLGLSLGSSTGYAVNPARDFGPRLVYFLFANLVLKRRKEFAAIKNWQEIFGFSYSLNPIIAPSLAGLILGLVIYAL
ncbi:aquaporin family protein [Mycoplasma hyopneumoniae]|uniref:MIP/aquaporin family protein n=1 Tax=Mesomycoplasma hyopneumoniae TaxID=2099 RepID=UPI00136BD344|nr:MIP/aquaporin family protein [Mesomycoplasma hyopneumoniae]MXR12871.1 aquaporin family protein [Mesomycoplasma hyopneumoniae]